MTLLLGAYGLRTRLRVLRLEGPANRALLRWYPVRSLLDPYAFLDLTSVWEQAWATRWMADERQGTGAVVELGTWLGASTRAIARGAVLGARRSGGAPPTTVAYDTFAFADIEARLAGSPLAGRHRDGSSFRSVFDRRVGSDLLATVDVRAGDVLDQTWDGGPIEFLFVDVAKTWEIWRHVRATWLVDLQVGGVVVQQDWAHANTPWLHLWHHRWRDHFDVIGHIPHSSSVVFRLVAPLPAEAFAPDAIDQYDPDEISAAFAWSADLVQPDMRPNIVGAEVMLHALHGHLHDGVDALIEGAATGPVTRELAAEAIPELARRIVEQRSRATEPAADPTD